MKIPGRTRLAASIMAVAGAPATIDTTKTALLKLGVTTCRGEFASTVCNLTRSRTCMSFQTESLRKKLSGNLEWKKKRLREREHDR